jgi:hypothetical protein
MINVVMTDFHIQIQWLSISPTNQPTRKEKISPLLLLDFYRGMLLRSRAEAIIHSIVTVHPHEIPALLHSASTFFFVSSSSLSLSSMID